MTDLLSRLSAHALEKYPVKVGYYLKQDLNERDRKAYLSGLIAFYEKFGREIASDAYEKGIKSGVSSVEVYCEDRPPYLSAQVEKAEYLNKQFPEPKNEAK